MSANPDDLERIRQEREKLLKYRDAYRDLQQQMPYINAGLNQIGWTEKILQSPCGTEPSIREEAMEGLRGWATLPNVPDFSSFGVTGAYGIGTSACSSVAEKVWSWRMEKSSSDVTVVRLVEEFKANSNEDSRISRLESILRARDESGVDREFAISEPFLESVRYYNAWKANPGDSKALCTAMRNTLEKFKGQVNLIACEVKNAKPRDDFSWPKMIDAIGAGNRRSLLLEKSRYEKLHSDLSQYLKGNQFPSSEIIENTYADYINNIDSVIHLLDSEVKRKYFGIMN